MKRLRYCVIAIVILTLLWFRAELRAWQLTREIAHVHLTNVTFQAVDAATRGPLPIVLHTAGTAMDQRWPKEFGMKTTGDPSTIDVHWVGVEPVTVGVSAEGYEESDVQVAQPSGSIIVVPLQRLGKTG